MGCFARMCAAAETVTNIIRAIVAVIRAEGICTQVAGLTILVTDIRALHTVGARLAR